VAPFSYQKYQKYQKSSKKACLGTSGTLPVVHFSAAPALAGVGIDAVDTWRYIEL
jgi:hypothetical protein